MKYKFLCTLVLISLLSGCNRKQLKAGAAPDPSGLPVGIYNQTSFNECVWG
jgi:hypothetical protein